MLAPDDDMRPCDGTQRSRFAQSAEIYKLLHIILICAPCFFVGDVAEPFDFGGNVGELAVLGRS